LAELELNRKERSLLAEVKMGLRVSMKKEFAVLRQMEKKKNLE
jgi:hypothetical protein